MVDLFYWAERGQFSIVDQVPGPNVVLTGVCQHFPIRREEVVIDDGELLRLEQRRHHLAQIAAVPEGVGELARKRLHVAASIGSPDVGEFLRDRRGVDELRHHRVLADAQRAGRIAEEALDLRLRRRRARVGRRHAVRVGAVLPIRVDDRRLRAAAHVVLHAQDVEHRVIAPRRRRRRARGQHAAGHQLFRPAGQQAADRPDDGGAARRAARSRSRCTARSAGRRRCTR